jgi:hypothetical protein
MIILSEDTYKFMKKIYMKSCIKMILIGAGMYIIINKLIEQDLKINDLTKKIEELNSKGE